MEAIFSAVGLEKLRLSGTGNDDDVIDRFNHVQTTFLLIIFAVLVTSKQFVGDPINCWVPAHFTDNQADYANSYCWIRNTYYLPNDRPVPKAEEEASRNMIPYYQWLPLILLLQALFFYLPNVVWHTLNRRSGVDISSIVSAAQTFNQTEMAEVKEKTRQHMTVQIDRFLTMQTTDVKGYKCTISIKHCLSLATCRACGRRRGNYLVMLYLLVKVLYVANVIGQLFILDVLLGSNFHMYGIDVIAAAVDGLDWTETARFPRVSLCDFRVRRLGNVHRYTVQCVLPINQFNEKIYLFLWFWMVAVAAATCYSSVKWLYRFAVAGFRQNYVLQHLGYTAKLSDNEKKKCRRFVAEYLKQDGAFILQLVSQNADSITATELTRSLWDNYEKKHSTESGEINNDDDDDDNRHRRSRCSCC